VLRYEEDWLTYFSLLIINRNALETELIVETVEYVQKSFRLQQIVPCEANNVYSENNYSTILFYENKVIFNMIFQLFSYKL